MFRIKWIVLGCAAVGLCVALASSVVKADDGQSAIQPAGYRVPDAGTNATTQLVRHWGGGGFGIGINVGPGWGYGGYGGYGGYYQPYYGGYGYGYPGGYYNSYPSYGYYSYPSYGYYSYPNYGYGGWYY